MHRKGFLAWAQGFGNHSTPPDPSSCFTSAKSRQNLPYSCRCCALNKALRHQSYCTLPITASAHALMLTHAVRKMVVATVARMISVISLPKYVLCEGGNPHT